MKQFKGFTLLEVLIALMILSVTLTAIFYAISEDSRIAMHLRTKTFAHLVGLSVINTLQIDNENSDTKKNLVKALDGTSNLFDRTWYWDMLVINNENPFYAELNIEIRAEKKAKSITSLRFFLRKRSE